MKREYRSQRFVKPWLRGLFGMGLGCGLLAGGARADDPCRPVRPVCPPPVYQQPCPPSGVQPLPIPQTPPREGEGVRPTPPTPQLQPQPMQEAPSFAQAPMQGTAAPQGFAPNMLGDFFGGGTRRSTQSTIPVALVTRTEDGLIMRGTYSGITPDTPINNIVFIREAPGPLPNQPPGTFFVAAGPVTRGALQQTNTLIPLANSQPNAVHPAVATFQIANGTAQPFLVVFNDAAGKMDGLASVTYTDFSGAVNVSIPSPGAGANVGRGKIAENNSPMPRDRVYFRYSYFDNIALAPGQHVHRFTPGAEKTFFDGDASVEVRFPFAATVDPSYVAEEGLVNRSTEFGNFQVIAKFLVYSEGAWHVSTGMGVALPTAHDINVRFADNTPVIKIENEVVHLMPYVGALYTPDDQLFVQGFLQLDYGAGTHPVFANPDLSGLQEVGKLHDVTFMTFDIGAGYWLYRDPQGEFLTALAPLIELHYNFALEKADVITSGPFKIGNASRFDIVNLTVGTHIELGNDTTFTLSFIAPLTDKNNREFDFEIGLLLNHRFGPVSGPY
jgi:hypothetical protein